MSRVVEDIFCTTLIERYLKLIHPTNMDREPITAWDSLVLSYKKYQTNKISKAKANKAKTTYPLPPKLKLKKNRVS